MNSILSKGSEAAFDFHCDLCERDNNYVEAIGYCVDCKDYLCQNCFNYHRKSRPSRHHVLLDQHGMPTVTSQRQRKDLCTEPCDTHNNKILEYYCTNHDKFGCGVCITLDHRNCEDVNHIPDIAGDVLTSKEYKDMILKMKTLTKTAQQAINTTQAKKKTTNIQHDKASEFFKQMRKELIAAVDRLETSFIKDAGKIRDDNQKKIKSVEEQYNKLLRGIGALDSKFTSLENKGQHCQIFFSMKRSRNEIAALETSLLQLQDQSYTTEYVIKMSDNLQHLVQQPEKMASLDIINNPHSTSLAAPVGVSSCTETRQKKAPDHIFQPIAAYTVVSKQGEFKSPDAHGADIGVMMKSDIKTPYITSSVLLPGNKLVIVDFNNYKVKIVNLQSNEIVAHLKHDSRPWDIAAVTNTQVAVTCPDDEVILFIKVTNTLTLDHKVKVEGECRGIACINDKFVVTYPFKVEIISKTGKLLQTLLTYGGRRKLTPFPFHVTVSPDQQTIYISYLDINEVTSFDLRGQVKATYEDDELKRPHGLTVDRDGVLYVCGENSIHQLTPDLHKIQILLQESDGVKYPRSVSYNEEQNKLYIGMWPSGIVKVYQLQ